MNTNYCHTCGTHDDVPHTGREGSRLSDADRETMDARLVELIATWAQSMPTRQYSPTAGDVVAMTRAMAHAIGCSIADLRVCELAELNARACAVVGSTYDHAGRFMMGDVDDVELDELDPIQTWVLVDDADREVERFDGTTGDMCTFWDGIGGFAWRVVNMSTGRLAMVCEHDWNDTYVCETCDTVRDVNELDVARMLSTGEFVCVTCPQRQANPVTVRRTRRGVRLIIADMVAGRMVDAELTYDEARDLSSLLDAYINEGGAS